MHELYSFGAWVRRRRKALDLTQDALARRVNCAAVTIRRIEADERRPSRELTALLAQALDIPPEQREAFLRVARAEQAVDQLPSPVPITPASAGPGTPRSSGTLTFLFTDIAGSTRLWEQYPQAMPQALARHDSILRQAIEAHDGHVYKLVGDAFCAAFATAPQALQAALNAQRALQAEPWGATGPVAVRMALHTGVTEQRDGDYVGPCLNRLSRLLAAGHGGQVLLSEVCYGLVRDDLPEGVTLRDMGQRRLRDLTHPDHVYQLVAPGLPAAFPPLKTLEQPHTNLPIQATSLIGREQEVSSVCALLRQQDVRLLTLTGPGGIGKTRLALQVAAELLDDFSDGVYFVDLAPISDVQLVVPAIAKALMVREAPGQTLLEGLSYALGPQRLLLVLDNCEQVLAAGPQLAALLAAAPGLKLLATSRVLLKLRGEQEYPVPPLGLPTGQVPARPEQLLQYAALRLFLARARDAQPGFDVSGATAPTIVEICQRLDGLPLAIELAAARLRTLTPDQLLARLSQRLALLTGGPRDLPPRQQTLRNTIDWSYQLLSPTQQRLFAQLGVFIGGFTLEAAEAVCSLGAGGAHSILDELAALQEQSLLRQALPEGRFWLLETLREYALERLAEHGELDLLRQRHAEHALALLRQAQLQLRGPQATAWLTRLEREHDNLLAALRWLSQTHPALALELVTALCTFWWRRKGFRAEGYQYLTRILAQTEQLQTAVRAEALARASYLAGWHQQATEQRLKAVYAEQSLALAERLGDRRARAIALVCLGWSLFRRGAFEQAAALAEQSLPLSQAEGDLATMADAYWLWGQLTHILGQHSLERTCLEHQLAITREMGDLYRSGFALQALADALASDEGDFVGSAALLNQALECWRLMGEASDVRRVLHRLGTNALLRQDFERAQHYFAESRASARQDGDRRDLAYSAPWRSFAALRGGAAAAARRDLAEGLALVPETVDLEHDRSPHARITFALYLICLAEIALTEDAHPVTLQRAARLGGAAAAELSAHPIDAPLDRLLQESLASSRRLAAAHSLEALWDAGQALSLEQALAEAQAAARRRASPD